MKRLMLLSLVIALLLPSTIFAEDKAPVTVEEAVKKANEEIASMDGDPNYYDASKVNEEVWKKYGVLVYGSKHGDKKGDMSRYVGYTPDGVPFGNPVFPLDSWAGGTYDDRNWIESPWKDPRTQSKGAMENDFKKY